MLFASAAAGASSPYAGDISLVFGAIAIKAAAGCPVSSARSQAGIPAGVVYPAGQGTRQAIVAPPATIIPPWASQVSWSRRTNPSMLRLIAACMCCPEGVTATVGISGWMMTGTGACKATEEIQAARCDEVRGRQSAPTSPSLDFKEAVSPTIAVYQAGAVNEFGHPYKVQHVNCRCCCRHPGPMCTAHCVSL